MAAQYLTLTPSIDASSALILGTKSATLKGTRQNHIVMDETAVHISGNIALHAQHVKYATLFALQRPMRAIVPSCLGTPVPMTEIELPTDTLEYVAAGAAEMMALCGLMGVAAAGGSVV